MASEHDWVYGRCQRCGYSTDREGAAIEKAPPCTDDPEAYEKARQRQILAQLRTYGHFDLADRLEQKWAESD